MPRERVTPGEETKYLGVRVPESLWQWVEDEASKPGQDRSRIIRAALVHYRAHRTNQPTKPAPILTPAVSKPVIPAVRAPVPAAAEPEQIVDPATCKHRTVQSLGYMRRCVACGKVL